jgi:hypothetical protein
MSKLLDGLLQFSRELRDKDGRSLQLAPLVAAFLHIPDVCAWLPDFNGIARDRNSKKRIVRMPALQKREFSRIFKST